MTVLMIGPAMDAKGGISSVLDLYRQGELFERHRFLASTTDGSILKRVSYFIDFLERYLRMLMTDPAIRIVHIHIAVRGSVVRKSLVTAIAKLFRKDVILHFHGAQFNVLYGNSPQWLRALIGWSFRTADRVLCLSEDCREHIRDTLGVDAQVMPNPTILQAPVSQQADPVNFLFMGRLGKRKGVYDIIKAAASLPKEGLKIHLYGDGELDEVRRLVSETGVQDRVLVHGWISGDEKQRIFQQSQVLLLPSYNEGLPISILEALAYGMPVISTPVGGIPDAVRDGMNGYLIAPGDTGALAERIARLAASQALRLEMGAAGFQLAKEKFSLDKILSRLEELYTPNQRIACEFEKAHSL